MRICHGSDLHLEHNPFNTRLEFPDGDVLILPGDIVSAGHLLPNKTDAKSRSVKKKFNLFISKTKKYKKVIYVMGNHEYYDCVLSETADILNNFIKSSPNYGDNWLLLENDYAILDDVIFIGSTMWTNFNNHNISDMLAIQMGMPDYKFIWYNKDFRTRPDVIYAEHQRSMIFLHSLLGHFRAEDNKKPIVLVTHHPLINDSSSQMGSGLNGAFFSNLEETFYHYPEIKHYFFGHTHIRKELIHNYTHIHTNGCGYLHHGEHHMWHSFKFKTVEL